MPTTAAKMQSIKPSIIVEIADKARELKKQGRNIISFSIGVPNFVPAQHVYDAARHAVDNDVCNYLPGRGSDELIKAFIKRMELDGFSYSEKEVCVANGAKNALFNLFYVITDPGDEVIVPTPYWSSYEDIIEMNGGKMVTIRGGAEQHYKITAQQLEAAITPKTKALLFNNPSNPTGMVYTREEIKALGDVLAKHDIWIISDDIYDKMIFDDLGHHHLLHTHPQLKDRVVIVQSISKTYGMPGWRVGMVAGPERIIKLHLTMMANTTMNVNGVAMAAAAAAFGGDHAWVAEVRDTFQAKRDMVVEALNDVDGLLCPKPQGAFYAFPDVSAYFGAEYKGEIIRDDVHVCNLLLDHHDLALVPGSAFGEPNSVRISYACPTEQLCEGLQRFAAFFAACEGRKQLSA